MEKIGYILLLIVVICWITAILAGIIIAFPYGVIGLLGIIGIGLLFAKAVKDRLNNKEDNYYSDNVDK